MGNARYSAGAMILHWAIAIAVIVNWRIAEGTEGLSREAAGALMDQHKALGITILLLTVLRVLWRMAKKPPPLASSLKGWEVKLAKTVHLIFYVLLIGLPLGGWLGNSMFGQGIDLWGLFTMPALPVPVDYDTGEAIFEVHETLGKAMLILIGLHILGALKHTLVDKDGNLFRMLPFGTPKA
jgi:cytochrome b561